MAGGKETPRQKMIGMMYLVLTALLALNVSKSILDAFVAVNESLESTTHAFDEKNQTTYSAFANSLSENQAKTQKWYDKAQEVKAESDKLYNFVNEVKAKMLNEVEKKAPTYQELIGPNADGIDTVWNVAYAGGKDNYDVPAQCIGLADPSKGAQSMPDGIDAVALVGNISSYRDKMIQILPEKSRDGQVANTVREMFAMHKKMEHGLEVTWEVGNFYHAPLAACITHLSKLQADIRNAEADMIKFLYGQVDAASYKFNKLSPAVIAEQGYLLVNDTFRAEVFLAAFDTTSDPMVTFAPTYADSTENGIKFGGDTLGADMLTIKDGKGILKIPATSEGLFTLKGLIKFKGPTGDYIDFPVATQYQVAKPSLTVSPTKMNVFYKGVDNPVSISAPGVPADKIRPSISNGSISKGQGGYVVKVKSGNKAIVSVSATLPDGSSVSMGKVEFRVKTVPNPAPFFAGKGQGDDKVKKSELTAAQGVAARMENFDFDLKFTVTSFKLTMIVGGTPIEKVARGNRVTGDMKTMLKKAKRGQKVYIENIRAKGPDGTVRKLGSIALKVI